VTTDATGAGVRHRRTLPYTPWVYHYLDQI
jgi:hypothetical protein